MFIVCFSDIKICSDRFPRTRSIFYDLHRDILGGTRAGTGPEPGGNLARAEREPGGNPAGTRPGLGQDQAMPTRSDVEQIKFVHGSLSEKLWFLTTDMRL